MSQWAPSSGSPDGARAASPRELSGEGASTGGALHAGAQLQAYLTVNYSRLHRCLVRQLRCPDLASDSLHDAWLRLGDMTSQEMVNSPDAFICRVACNAATDRLRSDRPWQYADDAGTELENLVDPSPDPDQIAQGRSEIAALDRAMRRLPRRHQAVLAALRIDGMSRQDVARRYALSLRSVDTALRQALDHCAGHTGRPVQGGVSAPRRAVRQAQAPR